MNFHLYIRSYLFTENGFCDHEVSNTSHGKYTWNETIAGETDKQTCVFGTKDGFEGGKAERFCISHDMWGVYDGSACVTEVTYRIGNIAEVLYVRTSYGKEDDYLSLIHNSQIIILHNKPHSQAIRIELFHWMQLCV